MVTTFFLAKLIGVMYLTVGLGLLFNGKHFKKMMADFAKSPALTYFAGVMIVISTTAALLSHNIWEGEWYVILITVFLWLGFLKGALFIIVPGPLMKLADAIWKKMNFTLVGVCVILMGVLFSYLGLYI